MVRFNQRAMILTKVSSDSWEIAIKIGNENLQENLINQRKHSLGSSFNRRRKSCRNCNNIIPNAVKHELTTEQPRRSSL
jgi:uncharacterized protein with PIN domain